MKKIQVIATDIIERLFYTHGMFCASHPYATIMVVICITLLACHPLWSVPILVNAPLRFSFPIIKFTPLQTLDAVSEKVVIKYPRWYRNTPAGYIQQIIIKAAILPWKKEDLVPGDAVRGPLGKVFDVIDFVNKFRYKQGTKFISISDLCLHVDEPTTKYSTENLLPQYGCLMLSPARLWNNERNRFYSDPNLLKTIRRNYGTNLEPPPSIQDLLLGVYWKKTGLSGFFLQSRQRPLTVAVTIIFKHYNYEFIEALKIGLNKEFSQSAGNYNDSYLSHVTHVHYERMNTMIDYSPLILVYVALFLYIYFSVQKIDMVKSKWGLAISAVATVIASFLISLSACNLIGASVKASEVFPYLCTLIGFENMIVLTKSVMSTPSQLDSRYRMALGLQKEGMSFSKTLAMEFCIILLGICTMAPEIQMFCLLSAIYILSDIFLQLFFFCSVLSVDIRRTENLPLFRFTFESRKGHFRKPSDQRCSALFSCPFKNQMSVPLPTTETEFPPDDDKSFFRLIPNRIRFYYFLADHRFLQRTMMVIGALWIIFLTCNANLVQRIMAVVSRLYNDPNSAQTFISDADALKHVDHELWNHLYDNHWVKLFGHYKIMLFGRYITILPSILIASSITPHEAVSIRLASEPRIVDPAPEYSSHIEFWNLYSKFFSYPIVKGIAFIGEWKYFIVIVALAIGLWLLWEQFHHHILRWNKDDSYILVSPPTIFAGISQDISCMVVSDDSSQLISCDLDGSIAIWNTHSQQIEQLISRSTHLINSPTINVAANSPAPDDPPSGHSSARSISDVERPLHVSSNSRYGASPVDCYSEHDNNDATDSNIWCMACRDGIIVCGCSNGEVEFWDMESGVILYTYLHSNVGVTHCRFIYDKLAIVRLNSVLELIKIVHLSLPSSLLDSNAGCCLKTLENSSGDKIALHRECRIRLHSRPINHFVSYASLLVSASQDHSLKITNSDECSVLHDLRVHTNSVLCVHIEKDIQQVHVFSGSSDQTICVWNLASGQFVRRISGLASAVVSVTTTDQYLVGICSNEVLHVLERQTFQPIRILTNNVSCINMTVCKNNLVVSSQTMLYIWDMSSTVVKLKPLDLNYKDESGQIYYLLPLPDGRLACAYGRNILVIDLYMTLAHDTSR